jgi:hypothetical protein
MPGCGLLSHYNYAKGAGAHDEGEIADEKPFDRNCFRVRRHALLLAASPAQARLRDNPNYGYCKSGHIVRDIKFCREFGGRR